MNGYGYAASSLVGARPTIATRGWTGEAGGSAILEYLWNQMRQRAGMSPWTRAWGRPVAPEQAPRAGAPEQTPRAAAPEASRPAERQFDKDSLAEAVRQGFVPGGPFEDGEFQGPIPAGGVGRMPLRIGWGAGAPQDYIPGRTDVRALPGAAPLGYPERTFMGTRPMIGGGGFTPSARWEDVAAPSAFPSYEEGLREAALRREVEDPLWRERQESKIRREEQVGIASDIAKLQAESRAEAAREYESLTDPNNPASAIAALRATPEYQSADRTTREQMEYAVTDRIRTMLNIKYGLVENPYATGGFQ